MRFVEHVKNVFSAIGAETQYFVHNATFDAVLLADVLGEVPEVVRASNGRAYIYFENMNTKGMVLARQMGFAPRLHRSHRYFPVKYIYRVRVTGAKTPRIQDLANEISTMDKKDIAKYKSDVAYKRYVANYKIKTK